MTPAEVEKKFRQLTTGHLSPAQQNGLVEGVATIETARSITPLLGQTIVPDNQPDV